MLLSAVDREEQSAPPVVTAVGEELQGQERMSRPTLAQIELIAYVCQEPAGSRTATKWIAKPPITPSRASRSPTIRAASLMAAA